MIPSTAPPASPGPEARPPLLSIEHVTVELPTERGYVRVLDDVSIDVGYSEVVGLAGESGSGKTMTALTVMRLLAERGPRIEGRITFDGVDLLSLSKEEMRRRRGAEIAMVFQEPMTSLDPAWTVGEQIAETVRLHLGLSRAAARDRAVELLDQVGIPDAPRRARQYSFEMSGGMQQRVMIAIALSCGPRLLIADEPTTALDVTVQAQIVELVQQLQADLGMAVLFVTHDLGLLAEIADRIAIMYASQVIEVSPARELFRSPSHPYTKALLMASPRPGSGRKRLPTIPGVPPQSGWLPTGCRFHPRCTVARPSCSTVEPTLEVIEGGRLVRCPFHATEVEAPLGAR